MTSELQLQVLWYGVATSSGTQGARKAAAAAASVTKAGNPSQVHGRKPPIADVDEWEGCVLFSMYVVSM